MGFLSNPIFWICVGVGVIISGVGAWFGLIKPKRSEWFTKDDPEYECKKQFNELFCSAIDKEQRPFIIMICVAMLLLFVALGVFLTEEQTESTLICTHCEQTLEVDEKYCSECGWKVDTNSFCSECGELVDVADKFCADCGTKVKE